MRAVLSILASLAAFYPGLLLGFEAAQRWAPSVCPAPDGPNLCALLAGIAITWVAPFVASTVAGALVWRCVPA
jgi:hypothetical protein